MVPTFNVNVHSQDRGKYWTRKGTIAMNVLGVCAPTCNLSMFFQVGKALHMMFVSFAMLFLCQMALEFPEVIYIFKRKII